MKRSLGRSTSTPVRSPRAVGLQCPECTARVRVARDELIEGAEIGCAHCGFASELTREYEELHGKHRWVLVDPLVDYDEDEDQRLAS